MQLKFFTLRTYLMAFAFALRHHVPIELQTPVEAAHIDAARVAVMVLQRAVVDNINDRTHDGRRVPGNTVQ